MLAPAAPSLVAFLAAPGHRSITGIHTEISRAFTPVAAHYCRRRSWNDCSARAAGCHPPRHRPVGGRLCMQDFSSSAYWNKVYTSSGEDGSAPGQEAVTEWHVEGELMVEAVERLLGDASGVGGSEELAILNVGCGKSTLWESMYDHGWRNITNIDFSTPCIEQGRRSRSSRSRPGVLWLVMDACSLTFGDNSFDLAVDKGTLDAIACSEAFDWYLPRMARSIVRVLRPGGTWVCVSFTPPEIALPLLEECEEWRVDVERLESFWMYVGRKQPVAGSEEEEGEEEEEKVG